MFLCNFTLCTVKQTPHLYSTSAFSEQSQLHLFTSLASSLTLQTKSWRGDPFCDICPVKYQEAGNTNARQTGGTFLLNNTFSCFEQRWIQTKRSILGGNWWRLFSHPITHMHMASLHFYIHQSDLQTLKTRSPLVLQIYTALSNWSLIKEVLNLGWSEDPPGQWVN